MSFSFFNKKFEDKKDWDYRKGCEVFDWDDVMAEMITNYAWSPIVFKDGICLEANFLYADYLALDFDSGEPSLKSVEKSWCDTAHIIGTTQNHQRIKHKGEPGKEQAPCDRFRLVIKITSRCENVEDFKWTAKKLARECGADTSATCAARYFKPCREIISNTMGESDMLTQGIMLKPYVVPVPPPVQIPGREFYRNQRVASILKGVPIPAGHRNKNLYLAVISLKTQGITKERISDLFRPHFLKYSDFSSQEFEHTLSSAYNSKTASTTPNL